MYGREQLEFFAQPSDYRKRYGLYVLGKADDQGMRTSYCFQPIGKTASEWCWEGNEHVDQFLSAGEARRLMNALWDAGVRPDRE